MKKLERINHPKCRGDNPTGEENFREEMDDRRHFTTDGKKRLSKNNKGEYKKIDKEITEKCNAAKEKWFDERCQEIESRHVTNDNNMYKNIEEVTGKRTCSATGYLKSKEGNIILEKDKILERWSEYIGELYNVDRNEKK